MSLAEMDLGPKMDWTLDNGLYQRFKVFKERCTNILSGPLHAIPEENHFYYLRYWMGEEGFKLISQWNAEGKSQMVKKRHLPKRNLRLIGNPLRTMPNPSQILLIAVVELKRLFQGSMTLEQFVTKATFLVDEAGYTARYKDRMLLDTLIAGFSNDVVWGKDYQESLDVTLAQVLEISRLETATQQSLSQMSNTKPSVNYVRYDKKRKNKSGRHPPQQQTLGKFHGSGSLPSSGKSDASGKFQIKGKICYGCVKGTDQPDQKCGAIDAICNKCGKKDHYGVICQNGKGFPHSSRSAKSQKIPEKSKLLLEFPMGLHYKDFNGSDINCISLRTFQRLFPKMQLNRSTLLLENYGNSPSVYHW